jgi:carbon monoxide dehydrogenase subunit G
MSRTTLAALAFVALAPLTAYAHGPTRQKVVQTIEINAPPEKVWAAIGNFQDMSWHPAIAKAEGSGDSAAGAKRMLTLKSGGRIDEALTAYSADAKSYSYEITAVDVKTLPVSNYSSSIRVTGEGAKSTVEWKGAFYRGYVNNDPPPELSDEAAVAAVGSIYKSGLDALKAKLEAGG